MFYNNEAPEILTQNLELTSSHLRTLRNLFQAQNEHKMECPR